MMEDPPEYIRGEKTKSYAVTWELTENTTGHALPNKIKDWVFHEEWINHAPSPAPSPLR